MARENSYTRFLRDPDPVARRAELEAFIGPNPAPFLKMYDKLWERPDKPGNAMFGFVPMALLLEPCWFFYRKVWVAAWVVVAAQVALIFLPVGSGPGIGMAVALAMLGRYTYLTHAIARITKLRGDAAIADLELLRREGGVSKTAGWVSSAVYLLLCAAALVAYVVVEEGRGAY